MKHDPQAVQSTLPSPLGDILIAASAQGLIGLWFHDQKHLPSSEERARWLVQADHPVLQATAEQLDAYFRGMRKVFDLPLDLKHGTPFQQSVWQALCTIGPGHTGSYGELARRIGKPQAVRAVGAAVGRNPVSLVVPCHRVVGAQGALTGYAGGLDRKAALLRLEASGQTLF